LARARRSKGDIRTRKDEHLALAATDAVAFRTTNLLECVSLVHDALPEGRLEDVDLSTPLLGKTLRAPLVVASMTGGTKRAATVNRELARIAESRGIAFGLGSQRAMQKVPQTAWTYEVRAVAPTTLLFGNLGVVQARAQSSEAVARLVSEVGADALCLHMNAAMELVQPGGDRDFTGGVETFARLSADLAVPVVAKETGAGISPRVAEKLRAAGVHTVDVSGAGGTSWTGVETLRAKGVARGVGQALWDWGIPTAASIAFVAEKGMTVIGTGGIKTGLDVARAIALGATACGIARPVLQAFERGGREGALAYLDEVTETLRAVMLLTGCRTPRELQSAPRVVTGALRDWLEALG
jgi:isopentenyl-diphosphate delta-isomerase